MASDEQDQAEAALAPGARRQRPPATIDLTATEIAGAPAAPAPVEPEPAPAKMSESDPSIAPDAEGAGQAPPSAGPTRQAGTDGLGAPGMRPDPAPRLRRRGGVIPFALAGALVAVVAAGLPWGLGLVPVRDSGADELAAKIAALDLQIRDAASRPQLAADKAVGDLGARVDAVSQQLARLEADVAHSGSRDSTAPAAPDPALAGRMAATETAVRALGGSLDDLRARADKITEKLASPPPAAAADQGTIDALTARIAALEAAAQKVDQRLSAAPVAADAPVRVALVALELRVAVEHGVPFATELAAAKPLIQDSTVLEALEPVAASGLPTPQALSRELSNLSPAMLRAAGTPAHEVGLLERLQANAERLVRIRPIAEAPGDDPSTVIVRAEVKAAHGDIAGAVAEINSLPPDVKAPAAAWSKSAQLRIGAVEAARKFSVGALAALGKPVP
jgi:hypothetical protein